jgi:hypothetical protein
MISSLKRVLKRMLKRTYVKFLLWYKYKVNTTDISRTPNEVICTSICRKLILHPDSELTIAPISDKRYLKNKTLGLFIVLYDRQISITNHIYHYDVIISTREWDKLISVYNLKTESIRKEYEEEIHSQIKHSLHTILDKISND